jgi:hypothetical protein
MAKQLFLSHAWGKDNLNRDNHLRCKELTRILTNKGYSIWFDDNEMYGNIDSAVMKGINNCHAVLICLTEKYCNKINNAIHMQTPNDNCFKEWNYSLFKQKIIIPIIMEPCMNDILLHQDGVIQMYLNSTMYIDLSDRFEHDNGLSLLYKTLKKYNIYNREERQFYNIKENSSFDNLIILFNNALKSLSPRSPIRKKNRNGNGNSNNDVETDADAEDAKNNKEIKKEILENNKILRRVKTKKFFKLPRVLIRI